MKMARVIVTATKELDESFGADEFLADMDGWTKDEIDKSFIDLIQEDIPDFLDEAIWNIEILPDDEEPDEEE
jgi:cell division septum initiation protein DivIVA